jgi:hypothetical protein
MNFNKIRSSLHCAKFPFEHSQRSKNIIFIHIPKTAGTSILNALGKKTLTGRQHLPWYIYANADPIFFEKAFKFSFIRNPLDKLYSSYSYLANGGNQTTDQIKQKTIMEYKDLNDFIIRGLSQGVMRNDPMFLPQSNFILDSNGEFVVDFVGRYENLENDFNTIAQKIGLKMDQLPHLNQTQYLNQKNNLSKDALEVLEMIYIQDFKCLNYSAQ